MQRLRLPDGTEVPDYYRIRLPDYVLVFAVEASDRVMVFEQYKHGPGRVCWGFPGGAIEHGERPLDAARRALQFVGRALHLLNRAARRAPMPQRLPQPRRGIRQLCDDRRRIVGEDPGPERDLARSGDVAHGDPGHLEPDSGPAVS